MISSHPCSGRDHSRCILSLLLPAPKEVWLTEQLWNSKWAWIQVLTILSPQSLVPGQPGVSPNVDRFSCKQDSLANGIYILAEMGATHSDEENLKTSNTKWYNYLYISVEKIKKTGCKLKYKNSPKLHFLNGCLSLLQKKSYFNTWF